MNFLVCEKRQSVINCKGHVLVLGGPGSGKTTLALFKAQASVPILKPGQKILFLSFSRAAVRQILSRCKEILTREERAAIDVRTYHAFCWEMLQSHGRLLGGKPPKMMTPGDEAIAKANFSDDWEAERLRLLENEAVVCFDLFAHGSARLFEESRYIRNGIGDLYPLIILDEFQDTDEEQWRLVKALASATTILCLADAEQRIYDFRAGVSPERLNTLRKTLEPIEADLAGENHRSGESGILPFADAVLRGSKPLPQSKDIIRLNYPPSQAARDMYIHFAVCALFFELRKRGLVDPCLAVLAPTNALIAEVSDILSLSHSWKNRTLRPVEHDVVWDAELSAAAALAVASILEYPAAEGNNGRVATLRFVSRYWLLKHASQGTKAALERAQKFDRAAEQSLASKEPRAPVAKTLCEAIESLGPFTGDPVVDWRRARAVFQDSPDLKDIFSQVRMVRLFRATDALAGKLSQLWLEQGSYLGSVESVRGILDRERLIGAEREPRGCVLMTMHKSKGKEFDGVLIVEGIHSGYLLRPDEKPHYEKSRRLLRVALTRARMLAVIVRPKNAIPL